MKTILLSLLWGLLIYIQVCTGGDLDEISEIAPVGGDQGQYGLNPGSHGSDFGGLDDTGPGFGFDDTAPNAGNQYGIGGNQFYGPDSQGDYGVNPGSFGPDFGAFDDTAPNAGNQYGIEGNQFYGSGNQGDYEANPGNFAPNLGYQYGFVGNPYDYSGSRGRYIYIPGDYDGGGYDGRNYGFPGAASGAESGAVIFGDGGPGGFAGAASGAESGALGSGGGGFEAFEKLAGDLGEQLSNAFQSWSKGNQAGGDLGEQLSNAFQSWSKGNQAGDFSQVLGQFHDPDDIKDMESSLKYILHTAGEIIPHDKSSLMEAIGKPSVICDPLTYEGIPQLEEMCEIYELYIKLVSGYGGNSARLALMLKLLKLLSVDPSDMLIAYSDIQDGNFDSTKFFQLLNKNENFKTFVNVFSKPVEWSKNLLD